MKDENYITIQGWMRNELKLKGNELMVYALIYGFSQDEESEFTGSIGYIADWIGATRQTVHNVLKSLCEKGLLHKEESYHNGIKFCSYTVILHPVKKFDSGVVKNFGSGSQKNRHNNIVDNTGNKTIDKKGMYEDVPIELKEIFMEWTKMRKEIKKPVTTKNTVTRALNKLNQLSEDVEEQKKIIEQSIDSCWQGFYPLKDKPKKIKTYQEEEVKDAVEMPDELRASIEKIFA